MSELQKSNEFRSLAQQVRINKRYADTLLRFLPIPLSQYCQFSHINNEDEMIIIVDSSVWLMKLKFYVPQIKVLFRDKHHIQIKQIKIKIKAPELTIPPPVRKLSLSSSSADALLIAADNISDNVRLQEALRRLAKHSKRS